MNASKTLAHRALSRAIKKGILKRLPCEVCGDRKTQGHHADYSKPLDVIWLCASHHFQLHFYGEICGTWRDWTAEFAFSPHLPIAVPFGSVKAAYAMRVWP